jgi:hypothetical protein
MSLTGQWQNLWTTPILVRHVPAPPSYNDQLKDLILQRHAQTSGIAAGVVDADKTRSDLLRWNDPLIDPLREWISEAAETMNATVAAGRTSNGAEVPMHAEAWAVIYHEWGYHNLHSHHDASWSGVYYVHTGRIVEGSGNIELLDPRPAANAREPHRSPLMAIPPEPGMLLAFPAWLQHWVTPYDGDTMRICVAFNIGFER